MPTLAEMSSVTFIEFPFLDPAPNGAEIHAFPATLPRFFCGCGSPQVDDYMMLARAVIDLEGAKGETIKPHLSLLAMMV